MTGYAGIGIVICLLGIVLELLREKKLITPMTIFCGVWLLILLFSAWNLYGELYAAPETVYGWILLAIAAFMLGYYLAELLLRNKKIVAYWGPKRLRADSWIPRYKLLYMLCAACLLIYLKDLLQILPQAAGSFSLQRIQQLRTEASTDIVRGPLENALVLLVVEPFMAVIVAVTAVDFFHGRRDKLLLGLTLAMVCLRVVTSGGRSAAIHLLLYLVISYTATRSRENTDPRQRKRNRIWMCFLLLAGAAVIAVMTTSRAGSRALETLYHNFAMQPYMLGHWGSYVSENELYGGGLASFQGFAHAVQYVLRNLLGADPFPESAAIVADTVNMVDQIWVKIGRRTTANAYVTGIWYLYYDFRLPGVAIGMLLLGVAAHRSYSGASGSGSQRSVCIYAFCCMLIFYMFARFQLAYSKYALGLLYLRFLIYKKASRRNGLGCVGKDP